MASAIAGYIVSLWYFTVRRDSLPDSNPKFLLALERQSRVLQPRILAPIEGEGFVDRRSPPYPAEKSLAVTTIDNRRTLFFESLGQLTQASK